MSEEYRLVIGSLWSWTAILFALLLSILILLITYYNYRNIEKRNYKIGLILLRGIIILLIFICLLEPVLVKEAIEKEKKHIIILIDTSESMNLKGSDEKKIDDVKRFIKIHEQLFKKFSSDYILDFFSFSKDLKQLYGIDDIKKLKADGKRTYILESLGEIGERFKRGEIGGVLLFSDGKDNGELVKKADEAILDIVKKINAPIYTFTPSMFFPLKDVSIESINYSPFVFQKNPSSIDVKMKVYGYKNRNIKLSFYDGNKLIKKEEIKIDGEKDLYKVSFEYLPLTLGSRIMSVVAESLEGEITSENNTKFFTIEVLRDRIRILQICGHPSWDCRFLRNFLKSGHQIDLISFFILVSSQSYLPFSSDDTALIPFPSEELFVEEIKNFDLVIFQDYEFELYDDAERYGKSLSSFVIAGGGLLVFGGERAFTLGSFEVMEDILPVKFKHKISASKLLNFSYFQPVLPSEAILHPILWFITKKGEINEKIKSLPQLQGLNIIAGLTNNGKTLFAHPFLKTEDGKMHPLIAVKEIGEGRTMIILTDTLWHWNFFDKGRNSLFYNEFLKSSILWLVKDPSLLALKIILDKNAGFVGEEFEIRLDIKEKDLRDTSFEIFRKDFSHNSYKEERVLKKEKLQERVFYYVPEKEGIYRAVLKATISGYQKDVDAVFIAQEDKTELQDIFSKVDYFRKLCSLSGGEKYDLETSFPSFVFKKPELFHKSVIEEKVLWNNFLILLLIIFFIGLELFLRKKLGYI